MTAIKPLAAAIIGGSHSDGGGRPKLPPFFQTSAEPLAEPLTDPPPIEHQPP